MIGKAAGLVVATAFGVACAEGGPPVSDALVFASYLGGSSLDDCDAITVDRLRNVYLGCHVWSLDFPRVRRNDAPPRGDVLAPVVKIDLASGSVVYSTDLGGSSWDAVVQVVVDVAGSAFALGVTQSRDFPTTPGALQRDFRGGAIECFVTKLDEHGAVIFSTLLGGNGTDFCRGIDVDAGGHIYVTGATLSTDFPTVAAFQSEPAGAEDAFVTKLTPDGTAIVFSTYLGGSAFDGSSAVAVDDAGTIYLAGTTRSPNFPVVRSLQPFAGETDTHVTVLDAGGDRIAFSTYLGGTGDDDSPALALDPDGSVYVVGRTSSVDFPTKNPFQPAHGGGRGDFFVTRLAVEGPTMVYATYLGGRGDDWPAGVAVDSSGAVLIGGMTASVDFPGTEASGTTMAGVRDAVVVVLDSQGHPVQTIMHGGSLGEALEGFAVDHFGNAFFTGFSLSLDLPVRNAVQPIHAGDWDVFLAEVRRSPSTRSSTAPTATSPPRQYEIEDLGTLGGTFSLARGINDRGQVIGESETATGEQHVFLWTRDEGMRGLGVPGIAFSVNERGEIAGLVGGGAEAPRPAFWDSVGEATEIPPLGSWGDHAATRRSEAGVVVGWSGYGTAEVHAFQWTAADGTHPLGVLGHPALGLGMGRMRAAPGDAESTEMTRRGSSRAWDVHADGHIVGESSTEAGPVHAVLWTPEFYLTDLGTLGGAASRAFAINDSLQVVGESLTGSGDRHAFLWSGDAGMVDLGSLGGRSSTAFDINSRGEVVGYSEIASGDRRAFVWTAQTGMVELGTLGGRESIARGINNVGQIVGESVTPSGQRHAALWQRASEKETMHR